MGYKQKTPAFVQLALRASVRYSDAAVIVYDKLASDHRPAGRAAMSSPYPAVEFGYTQAVIDEYIYEVDAASLENLPMVADGARYQLVDVDGDGIPGIVTEQAGAWLYKSAVGEAQYGPLRALSARPSTATDIVRVRCGQVVYWPNLGFGKFGRQIVMNASPSFGNAMEFRADRIRVGDIDGSGTTDIVYLGSRGATLWVNQSGNGFSSPRQLERFPVMTNVDSVQLADILGNGTSSLVWSSPLPAAAERRCDSKS